MSGKPFSNLRQYLWPVHRYELKKFIPLFCIAFFIGFNYNILRNLKDALLITATYSGAEVIPFIKVWGIVPAAILMTVIYGKLNNWLDRNRVFYAMMILFLIFFTIFSFVVYPMGDRLHLHRFADWLTGILPVGCKGLIAIIRYWTFSSFYVMSELWSTAILTMLFWGFTNAITPLQEAKRFYGLIATGVNAAGVISGQLSVLICTFYQKHVSFGVFDDAVIVCTCVILVCGLFILGFYAYLTERVLPRSSEVSVDIKKKKKIKLSMRQNIAYLMNSPYLLCVACIVLSYNLATNLIEVVWKDQVRQLYPTLLEYGTYMGHISSITGFIACIFSFLFSVQLIRRYGWTFTALIPPMILFLTGLGFFICFFGRVRLFHLFSMWGTSPLYVTVLLGAIQNSLSRASKFTLFDATKELAFVPLAEEAQLKGKAVIDGVGSRLGKSGGSLIHQLLLIIFSSIAASTHIVAGILLLCVCGWVFSVLALGKRFKHLAPAEEITIPEPQELATSNV